MITGIRFSKSSANTGVHVASLWTVAGGLLARATFTNETASGWQTVDFPTSVPIAANTIYVASYHTTTGRYSNDNWYFMDDGVDSPPLRALKDGSGEVNGVYTYSTAPAFPRQGTARQTTGST